MCYLEDCHEENPEDNHEDNLEENHKGGSKSHVRSSKVNSEIEYEKYVQ